MLKKLYIRNFILIDELELDFHDGFSVFTGETGAGKSIFIDCISILIGERMNTSMIRSGTDRTSITGVFSTDEDINTKLGENGYQTEKLEVFREINADGRSTTKVNGKNATLAFVKELLDGRIDIHCQRDSQYLLDENRHIQLLDRYCGNEALLSRVRKDFSEYKDLDRKYHNLLENEYNESQLEIIRYQVDEIEKAALKEGEEEQISASIKAFNDHEKIQKTIDEIKEIFNGQNRVLDSLYEFTKVSDHLEEYETIAKNISDINDAYYEIQDNFEAIINYFDSFEGDVTDIDRLNQRLYDIQRIKRKYNATVPEVLAKCQAMKEQLALAGNRQEVLDGLSRQVKDAFSKFEQSAEEIRNARQEGSVRLGKEIVSQLKDLNLEKAQFDVEITEGTPSSNGMDNVRFLISMNPGQPLRSLSSVASGGELSRLMLGLKTIFSRLQHTSLAIFDEIDTGVSGYVAFNMGLKIRSISKDMQVFSVTHLAAVAAHADHHYKIEKKQGEDVTTTNLKLLDYENTIRELAVLSSSTISDASLAAARELYQNARNEDSK